MPSFDKALFSVTQEQLSEISKIYKTQNHIHHQKFNLKF